MDAALSGGSDQGAALDKLKEVVGMLKQAGGALAPSTPSCSAFRQPGLLC